MIYFIIFVLVVWMWVIYEWINAPHSNEDTNNTN